ncbi:unnamed protein product [Prorocentrum cordatum]|uniref:Uncharacterized protein n=1 Tax=Prorocentrum cordatum TaxID=2364126 RepID=A0ABN9TPD3_9DINO|nr:unnamed protein product [Polarella glacialis]
MKDATQNVLHGHTEPLCSFLARRSSEHLKKASGARNEKLAPAVNRQPGLRCLRWPIRAPKGAGQDTENLNSEAANIKAEMHQAAKLHGNAQDCKYTRQQLTKE